jgi:FMN phosphatase YigB (HAD superfamily)
MAAGEGTSRHGRDGRAVDAVFFDLFGTLLDLGGLVEDCETAASGRGRELAARWRVRQLEFSWLRTTMGRMTSLIAPSPTRPIWPRIAPTASSYQACG